MNLKSLAIAFMLVFATGYLAHLAALSPQQNPRDKALLDAVEKGDRQTVLSLLSRGANVNAKGINDTALETAIFQQDVEMVQLLLDKGAKIEARDLGEAAGGAQGDKAKATGIVRLLLEKGASLTDCTEVDTRMNDDGSTTPGTECTETAGENALRAAARKNNLEIMRLLLSKGVPVNGRNRFDNSVLMEVVGTDAINAVSVLLDAGADVKAAHERGETVLMRAARADQRSDVAARIRLLKLLLARGADVRARDSSGQTALHHSVAQFINESGAYLAHAEITRLLLDSGADVNAQDKQGNNALMNFVQVFRAKIDIAQLLLEKGAAINLQNQEGATALMLAADKGQVEFVRLLLEKGAQIDAKDKLGQTALAHAIEAGESDVVSVLISKGADPSLTVYKTPDELKTALDNFSLLRAVNYRKSDEVRTLLERGANVNARERDGSTALMLAIRSSYQDETDVRALLEKGADVNATDEKGNTALMVAIERNRGEIVKLLLDRKAEVNVTNKNQKTPLLLAAEGNTRIAELLLAKGADIRVRDAEERTPLLVACSTYNPQEELVRLLLAKGADAKDRDKDGNTALILAVRGGAFQVIETLARGGVDVNATNNAGLTALRQAKESKEVWTKQSWGADTLKEIIRLLQAAGAKE